MSHLLKQIAQHNTPGPRAAAPVEDRSIRVVLGGQQAAPSLGRPRASGGDDAARVGRRWSTAARAARPARGAASVRWRACRCTVRPGAPAAPEPARRGRAPDGAGGPPLRAFGPVGAPGGGRGVGGRPDVVRNGSSRRTDEPSATPRCVDAATPIPRRELERGRGGGGRERRRPVREEVRRRDDCSRPREGADQACWRRARLGHV